MNLMLLTMLVILHSSKAVYDWTYGTLALWHSENTYCDPVSYLTRENKGILAGFVPTFKINDTSYDTLGYVGYTIDQNAIYVSFRGSETIDNWLTDINTITIAYPPCNQRNCEVHKGFYTAEQRIIKDVLTQVKLLKDKFPSYFVICTGHSLGAALALLTAVDLQNAGVTGVRLFNFGSPRVGTTYFAQYIEKTLSERNRVTHHKDTIVHSPLHYFYTHHSTEFYQPDDNITLKECSGGEDPKCANQWTITNAADHLLYLGVVLGENGCGPIL